MPGLVQERLVVVQAALGARDQMDDVRRIGGDDARARGLLRPVVEVEPDPGRALDVETECCERRDADRDGLLLGVRLVERRQTA